MQSLNLCSRNALKKKSLTHDFFYDEIMCEKVGLKIENIILLLPTYYARSGLANPNQCGDRIEALKISAGRT